MKEPSRRLDVAVMPSSFVCYYGILITSQAANWVFCVIDQRQKALYSYIMLDNTNFNRMVSGLSLDERQTLLTKLKSQSTMSKQTLYFDDESSIPASDIATQYAALPWYSRLWYFILSFVKSRSPIKIFEDYLVYTLGSKAEERSPGLYDHQRNLLLSSFCRHVEKLREAARFFYSALDLSVNRDRGAFFAFLGSLEMPDVHKKLQTDTDPLAIVEKTPSLPEAELRQVALKNMEEALTGVTEGHREAMYFNARSLNCLKELSSFLFDRITMAFAKKSGEGEVCSAGVVRELLMTLNNILLSLKDVPPMPLLQSLFVFTLQEKAEDEGFDMDRETRLLLAKAENYLGVIREFNRRVPLTWIIRCSTRDMSYSPRVISGGEDWFLVYREYWKHKIDSSFKNFFRDRRQNDLLSTLKSFLNGANLKTLENTQTDDNPDGLPVNSAFALSFLLTFYSAVFMPVLNKFLRPILIDAEFIDGEGRAEFAESYNNLMKLEDEIKKLQSEISPTGEYGERYQQARKEMSSLPIKRRKIQIVLEDVEDEAAKIIERVKEAARRMIKIISGVLGNDPRSKHYSLTNLSKMAGKDNLFAEGLEETAAQFIKLLKIMDDIDAIEYGH